jgi:hypothetical protein
LQAQDLTGVLFVVELAVVEVVEQNFQWGSLREAELGAMGEVLEQAAEAAEFDQLAQPVAEQSYS